MKRLIAVAMAALCAAAQAATITVRNFKANAATFTVDGDLTITPNVNVKGRPLEDIA